MKNFAVVLAVFLSFAHAEARESSLYHISSEGVSAEVSTESGTTFGTDFHSYYFGRVPIHTRSSVRFTVTNTGTVPLNFERATISGAFFDAYHSCGGVIAPQQRCSFEIIFSPAWEGTFSGRFALDFVEDSSIVVDVWGQGVTF